MVACLWWTAATDGPNTQSVMSEIKGCSFLHFNKIGPFQMVRSSKPASARISLSDRRASRVGMSTSCQMKKRAEPKSSSQIDRQTKEDNFKKTNY
jgi:hypothetical protein